MSSITTKRGDDGSADACSGKRLAKDDCVFDALGNVDELQCTVGVARCHLKAITLNPEVATIDLQSVLEDLQKVLSMSVCVSLLPACFSGAGKAESISKSLEEATERAEQTVKAMKLPPLKEFVVPGSSGCVASAQLHVCRAVCRRAERSVVHVLTGEGSLSSVVPAPLRKAVLSYMNRCSDLLFACALYVDLHLIYQPINLN